MFQNSTQGSVWDVLFLASAAQHGHVGRSPAVWLSGPPLFFPSAAHLGAVSEVVSPFVCGCTLGPLPIWGCRARGSVRRHAFLSLGWVPGVERLGAGVRGALTVPSSL